MSAIAALGHFCEVHGPRIVMVTQSVRHLAPVSPVDSVTPGQDQDQHLLMSLNNNQSTSIPSGCERCWSLKSNENLIVSKDPVGKQNYVSSQSVLNNDLDFILKNAVIRAISCEVTQKREGPVIFSDPSVSTVFANNFFIKDSKARGFQRYYSLLLMTREKEHIVSNLKMIETLTSDIVNNIKLLADKTFAKECPDTKEKTEAAFLRRRGSMNAMRNLKDVVGDVGIYENIHKKFVVILQSLERVLKEKVLSGQVMKSSVIFEKASLDIIVDIKSQLGAQNFKILLYHILSGKTLQIKSQQRYISRKIGDSLCLFLPNNLTRNQSCFANFILTTNDVVDNLPSTTQLDITCEGNDCNLESGTKMTFSLVSDSCQCFDSYNTVFSCCKTCKNLNNSTIITKLCKILKNCNLPKTVKEMTLRTHGETILLQSRVFSKLAHNQKCDFLLQNNFTAIDAEILSFFKFFS